MVRVEQRRLEHGLRRLRQHADGHVPEPGLHRRGQDARHSGKALPLPRRVGQVPRLRSGPEDRHPGRELARRPDARRIDPPRPLLRRPAKKSDGRNHQRRAGRGQAHPVHSGRLFARGHPSDRQGRHRHPRHRRALADSEKGPADPLGGRRGRRENRRPDPRRGSGQVADAPGSRPAGQQGRPFRQPDVPLRPDGAYRRPRRRQERRGCPDQQQSRRRRPALDLARGPRRPASAGRSTRRRTALS